MIVWWEQRCIVWEDEGRLRCYNTLAVGLCTGWRRYTSFNVYSITLGRGIQIYTYLFCCSVPLYIVHADVKRMRKNSLLSPIYRVWLNSLWSRFLKGVEHSCVRVRVFESLYSIHCVRVCTCVRACAHVCLKACIVYTVYLLPSPLSFHHLNRINVSQPDYKQHKEKTHLSPYLILVTKAATGGGGKFFHVRGIFWQWTQKEPTKGSSTPV